MNGGTSRVELLEMGGDPLVLAIIAAVLCLLCIAWAFGVPQLLRDLHRAGAARIAADDGRPLRLRLPEFMRLRPHDAPRRTAWNVIPEANKERE